MKPNRNDPCPCGSGKKYKKCCQISNEEVELEYRRQRYAEVAIAPILFEMALTVLRPDAIHDAWIEFNGDENVALLADDDPMKSAFMPWFLYSWAFEPKDYLPDDSDFEPPLDEEDDGLVTLGLIHLAVFDEEIPKEQREFLEAATTTPFTICEVLEVKPGHGIKVRDLFREVDLEIIDQETESFHDGDLIYCAPMTLRGVGSFLGLAPYALLPTHKLNVLNLRKAILADSDQEPLGDDELFVYGSDIRYLYLDLRTSKLSLEQLIDSEGNGLAPVKFNYELVSSDDAFDRLCDLAGPRLQNAVLKRATEEDGRIVVAEIPWVETSDYGRMKFKGLLKIFPYHLQVEVDAMEDTEQMRGIIEDRLGSLAEFISEEHGEFDTEDVFGEATSDSDLP